MSLFARQSWVAWSLCAAFFGCSGTGTVTPPGAGGGESVGGGSATGGAANSGGASQVGTTATGGNAQTGGAPATGGNEGVGGAETGGTKATGGTKTTGGTKATGGTSSTKATGGTSSVIATGGTSSTKATGGTSATGGSKAVGGAETGGTKATGGSKATGGTTASTGGSKATGGATASTGGTTSAGGAATFKCSNLSFAPSTTGVAKPSGAAGGLKVLDWAGFKSAISYTFDDANSSQINNYAAMKAAGGHYTFYLITSKSEAGNAVYKTAVQDGHEMANHTSDHSNCTSGSTIDAASTFIQSTFGVKAYAFAAPNGSSACNTTSVSSKFLTDRSVNGGSMAPGDTGSFTWLPSDIASASNMAPTAGKWRTICIHGFTGGSDSAYQPISLDSFTSAVKSAVSGGSWVETVTNVAAYQWGQKALSGKTTSATWTLPSVFPPNMCVRVTTSGGTVKQNGAEVPWNDHGYYEISLDAQSVTVE